MKNKYLIAIGTLLVVLLVRDSSRSYRVITL